MRKRIEDSESSKEPQNGGPRTFRVGSHEAEVVFLKKHL